MRQSWGQLLIEEIKLPPGQQWMGADGAWRFVHLHSGAAYWRGAEGTRAFAVGELMVAGPKIQGGVLASLINEVVLYAFNFEPELLSGFFTLSERNFFENEVADHFATARFLPATHAATQKFATLISDSPETQSLANRAELLGLALSVFGSRMTRESPPARRALTAQHRFQQLISKMPEAELVAHTPENLAELCGCSPRHFSRLFHQRFGSSVRARQTELRLLKARQLLRNPGLPVAQAAADSGYRHLSLFNALFKRKFGMTPTEWQQRQENAVLC